MKKRGRSWVLLTILSLYCLLYLWALVDEGIQHFSSNDSVIFSNTPELITVIFAFLVFLGGTIYSWFDEKKGGIIVGIWHFIVWTFSLLLWKDAGMVLILIFPMLIVSSLLITNGITRSNPIYATRIAKWEITLKSLLINYTAIYLLIVLTDIFMFAFPNGLMSEYSGTHAWDFKSLIGIVLIFSLILYLIAFKTAWHSKFNAGLMLVAWYLIILALTLRYEEFGNSGPWFIFGIPLLIQGFLYMYYQIRIRNSSST